MKIQYLGTAAAEGMPGLFCTCEYCTEARKRGGRNLRTRSQAIVDDKILIDFPPDTLSHIYANKIDLPKIRHCLITHTHSDHLYLGDMAFRYHGLSDMRFGEPITFYGSYFTFLHISSYIHGLAKDLTGALQAEEICPLKPAVLDGYTVTSFDANHDPKSNPVIYMIKSPEGKTMLYGNDTGYFLDETWEYFEKNEVKFDFVSLDCTACDTKNYDYFGHMSLENNVAIRERLVKMGCADEKTVFCCNHFAHQSPGALYDDMVVAAEKEGFLTSYDGMVVEF